MYTYRIVIEAWNSRATYAGARLVTYSRGWNRADALRRIGTVYVGQDGTVSDGISPWAGSNNLPGDPAGARNFPEWDVTSMRSVARPGRARLLPAEFSRVTPTVAGE